MRQGFNQNEFENFLKEHADEHRMYPSDNVWKGIYRHVHLKGKWQLGILILLFISTIIAFKLQTHNHPFGNRIVSNQLAEYHPSIGGWENLFNKTSIAQFIEQDYRDKLREVNAELQQRKDAAIARSKATSSGEPLTGIYLSGSNTPYAEENISIQQSLTTTSTKISAAETAVEKNALSLKKAAIVNTQEQFTGNKIAQQQIEPVVLTEKELKEITKKNRKNRISWQLSAMPTTSFRKLSEHSSNRGYILNNFPFLNNNPEKLVSHRPAIGLELGVHMLYKLNDQFRIRTGLQVNYSKYDINAYSTGQVEPVRIYLEGAPSRTYYSYSSLRNFGGEKPERVTNQYFQLAIPIGLEFTFLKRDNFAVTAAGSIQPNYLLNANSYLISTDFRNYAKAPDLLRKFNASTSGEVFVSYETGSTRWQVGPVVRYQLNSSFIKEYPIREHIIEYGFKIAVTNIIP
jgi:hypothetical protein